MAVIDLDGERPTERLCKDGILGSYLKYAQHQESPTDFHTWTCISMIASALGRSSYCSMGMWETYPNLYIILVGESAITHKSTAIKMGLRPFRRALPDTPMLAQKMSPEALINALANLSESEEGIGRSEAVIESSELSNLLGKSNLDDSLLKILTDLWDCPDNWSYHTLGRGTEKLKDVCINLLGGSTPSWLRNSVPESALEGGFFSRLILVQRPAKGEKNPRPIMTPQQRDAIKNVENDLRCIKFNMQGEFMIEDQAQQFFDEWYHEMNHPEKADSFMRGYYGRKGDFMQKIAMCMSASFSDDMRITLEDMMMAHRLLNENEKFTKSLVQYMGTTQDGAKYVTVLNAIRRSTVLVPPDDLSGLSKMEIKNEMYDKVVRKGIEHSTLQRNMGHKLRRDDLISAIDSLMDSGDIIVKMVGPRNKKVYIYVGKSMEEEDGN